MQDRVILKLLFLQLHMDYSLYETFIYTVDTVYLFEAHIWIIILWS